MTRRPSDSSRSTPSGDGRSARGGSGVPWFMLAALVVPVVIGAVMFLLHALGVLKHR